MSFAFYFICSGFEGNVLAAQALAFFAAGFEPGASTIAFARHELSCDADAQQRLRNEIATMLLQNDGQLTNDAVFSEIGVSTSGRCWSDLFACGAGFIDGEIIICRSIKRFGRSRIG